MAAPKHKVTIKGNRDGLVFVLDDACDFEEVLAELRFKLEKTHQKILTGPLVHVYVKLGRRWLDEADKDRIKQLIGLKGNLVIKTIESDAPDPALDAAGRQLKLDTGMIRSGQTYEWDGDLFFIGDVNPGGTIRCTGHIYVLGSLKGMAHAGCEGDENAVIAASLLKPTQLRIAGVISRPPDEWGIGEAAMEFAYLNDGKMEINKLAHLHKVRPEAVRYIQAAGG